MKTVTVNVSFSAKVTVPDDVDADDLEVWSADAELWVGDDNDTTWSCDSVQDAEVIICDVEED